MLRPRGISYVTTLKQFLAQTRAAEKEEIRFMENLLAQGYEEIAPGFYKKDDVIIER